MADGFHAGASDIEAEADAARQVDDLPFVRRACEQSLDACDRWKRVADVRPGEARELAIVRKRRDSGDARFRMRRSSKSVDRAPRQDRVGVQEQDIGGRHSFEGAIHGSRKSKVFPVSEEREQSKRRTVFDQGSKVGVGRAIVDDGHTRGDPGPLGLKSVETSLCRVVVLIDGDDDLQGAGGSAPPPPRIGSGANGRIWPRYDVGRAAGGWAWAS
jgi:hypothetical protein